MRQTDRLGTCTSGPVVQHGREVPGFSSCLTYPRLENEEAGKQETPMNEDKD